MFKTKRRRKEASGTEVTLFLNLAKDSSHTAFTLEFVNNIISVVEDPISGARSLEAPVGSPEAVAELFKIAPQQSGKKGKGSPKIVKTLLGTFSVPFKVTVTP